MPTNPPAEGMERLVVDVPDGMKASLQRIAKHEDLYMSQLVRRILTEYIADKENTE